MIILILRETYQLRYETVSVHVQTGNQMSFFISIRISNPNNPKIIEI